MAGAGVGAGTSGAAFGAADSPVGIAAAASPEAAGTGTAAPGTAAEAAGAGALTGARSSTLEPVDGSVRTLKPKPGVYRMLDADGKVLYVGKAKQLKRRVASYFGRRPQDAKTRTLLQAVASMDVTVTGTEQEALLLEYNLIKTHKPRFNVVLRDDKSYPYIHVSTEQEFPLFEFHRGSRTGAGRFFGPFPDAGAVRATLQQLQKLFRIRQCSDTYFANRSRPCLQYQIQRCTAPCVGLIGAADYRRDVEDAIRFIEGRGADVLEGLAARMEQSAAQLDYERAARYRDQIAAIRRVQQQQAIDSGGETDLDALGLAEEQGQHCVGEGPVVQQHQGRDGHQRVARRRANRRRAAHGHIADRFRQRAVVVKIQRAKSVRQHALVNQPYLSIDPFNTAVRFCHNASILIVVVDFDINTRPKPMSSTPVQVTQLLNLECVAIQSAGFIPILHSPNSS